MLSCIVPPDAPNMRHVNILKKKKLKYSTLTAMYLLRISVQQENKPTIHTVII